MTAVRNIAPVKGPKKQKYSIIIPAAGEGSRMKSYGAKSLIPLNKETVLERQLRIVKEVFPSCEIIVVSGFQSNKVVRHTHRKIIHVENDRYLETNVARSIGLGLKAATTSRIVVIYGDLVFNKEALIAPLNQKSMILLDSSTFMEGEVGCTINDGILENMMYSLQPIWSQVGYFTDIELRLLEQITWNKEYERMYGFEVINEIIHRGGTVRTHTPVNGKVIDLDSTKDILKALTI